MRGLAILATLVLCSSASAIDYGGEEVQTTPVTTSSGSAGSSGGYTAEGGGSYGASGGIIRRGVERRQSRRAARQSRRAHRQAAYSSGSGSYGSTAATGSAGSTAYSAPAACPRCGAYHAPARQAPVVKSQPPLDRVVKKAAVRARKVAYAPNDRSLVYRPSRVEFRPV